MHCNALTDGIVKSLIAKANSQARCENFHPITIFENTRCELAGWLLGFCDEWKTGFRHAFPLKGLKCYNIPTGSGAAKLLDEGA